MKYVNENIKRLREYKGWTQQRLGYELDKKKDAIYRIEKGEVEISHTDLIKIAEVFNVSLDELVYSRFEADKVFHEKKEDLKQYNIKTIHPTIDKDFQSLPENFKEFGKAMALEIYREVAGITRQQLEQQIKQDIYIQALTESVECMTNKLKEIEDNSRLTIKEVEELIVDCSIILIGRNKEYAHTEMLLKQEENN